MLAIKWTKSAFISSALDLLFPFTDWAKALYSEMGACGTGSICIWILRKYHITYTPEFDIQILIYFPLNLK